jgi:small ligand-binding sensory domain FIST
MELGKAVGDLGIRFGGDVNQRGFVGVRAGQMAVNRVVAQIGLPPKYQLAKGGSAVVTNLGGRHMPVNQLGLLAPKTVAVV